MSLKTFSSVWHAQLFFIKFLVQFKTCVFCKSTNVVNINKKNQVWIWFLNYKFDNGYNQN